MELDLRGVDRTLKKLAWQFGQNWMRENWIRKDWIRMDQIWKNWLEEISLEMIIVLERLGLKRIDKIGFGKKGLDIKRLRIND